MTRTLFILVIFICLGITNFNWAQDSSDLLDIYELKISNEDLAFLSCLAGGLACEQLGAGSININKFIKSVNDIS